MGLSRNYAANTAAVRIEDSSVELITQSEEAVHRELGCVVHHTRRHFGLEARALIALSYLQIQMMEDVPEESSLSLD